MSEHVDVESIQRTSLFPEQASAIFEQLDAADVEQFYKSYHHWSLQQRIEILQVQNKVLQQAIADNDELLQQVCPSPIALASLAQFQASGVNDIDLLDRMLERGEDWLDHTIQLLRHCEELNVIGDNYTQWCEHALEGAYDWIESMDGSAENDAASLDADAPQRADTATEAQLLQRLMSEDELAEKASVADHQSEEPVLADGTTVEEVTLLSEPGEITDTTEEAQREGEAEEISSSQSGIASTVNSAHEERLMPQVRQGGFWRFLRRLPARLWHE